MLAGSAGAGQRRTLACAAVAPVAVLVVGMEAGELRAELGDLGFEFGGMRGGGPIVSGSKSAMACDLRVQAAGSYSLITRVSQFLALSPVRGSWGHAGDEWFVDLGV